MNYSFDKESIPRLVRELDRRDARRRVFGSMGHQYVLRPPIARGVIEAFEDRHGVALPDDYRLFLTEIGDGGAGPYYGLLPFGRDDDGHAWDDGHLVGDLSEPFPHADAWNLPESFWSNQPDPSPEMPVDEQDRLMEKWDEVMMENYWNPAIMNGAIPICHLGCAIRHWLIISGEQKGYVWEDDRADEGGIYPLRDERGGAVTFSAWYMRWLNDALRECRWSLSRILPRFLIQQHF